MAKDKQYTTWDIGGGKIAVGRWGPMLITSQEYAQYICDALNAAHKAQPLFRGTLNPAPRYDAVYEQGLRHMNAG